MPIFLNNSGFFRGNSTTSCISLTCSFKPPTSSQETFGFSIITNFSMLNFFVIGIFFMIVRFFCSARTISPDLSFPQLSPMLTENWFPFGILIIASFPKMSLTSQTIKGGSLNLSSSSFNLFIVSFRILFSSSIWFVFAV